MTSEIWKPIPGFDGYEVSDQGRVRSFHKRDRGDVAGPVWIISDEPQRILSPGSCKRGYQTVGLRMDGKTHPRKIHALVMLAFIGEIPHGLEVCHNDGDPRNNRLSNLRYDTSSANAADMVRHERGSRLFSNETIRRIRELRATGYSILKLCRKFNASRDAIGNMCSGTTFREIGGPIIRPRHIHTESTITYIRKLRLSGMSLRELAGMFGISESFVSLIARGKRHKSAGGPIQGIDYQRPAALGGERGG